MSLHKKKKNHTSKSKRREQKRQQLREELKEVAGVNSRKDMFRIAVGTLTLLIALFLLLSMISFLFTGSADQTLLEVGAIKRTANHGGILGVYSANYLINHLFGVTSLLIPFYMLAIVLKLMLKDASSIRLWLLFLHFGFILVLGSIDAHYIQEHLMLERWVKALHFDLGGQHGKEVLRFMTQYIGGVLSGLLLFLLTLSYVGYWFIQIFIWFFRGIQKFGGWILGKADSDNKEELEEEKQVHIVVDDEHFSSEIHDKEQESPRVITFDVNNMDSCDETKPVDSNVVDEIFVTDEKLEEDCDLHIISSLDEEKAKTKTVEDVERLSLYDPKLDLSRYKHPPLSLLYKHDAGNTTIDMEEQNANKERIINVLNNFDVSISAISATIGPTVTLYEITPAPGVRIAKIRNLEDDIALSLSALGIRIIAPIPGKGTIGIEVPNRNPQVVSMESIINTQKFKDTKFELPIALGKTITNEIFMIDLAKMPHLLVAGATGQGKSVGLNALITSLLYKKHPSELKLVMIDPKKVEFSMYNPLFKHFLAQVPDSDEPVITDVKKVIQTLKSLCQEMDDRYDLLKKARCKNIKEYNAKFIERKLNPEHGHHFLPYIVVIIDEFGDLIMTAGKDIELPIARIAQLARAVGIHMVIATQSPRTTIITGKIKANFPGRIAFKVSGRVESMTILDRTGANNLIGRGDMLFLAGSDITRVQCAFVDTPEVEAITEYISQQQGYPCPYELPLVAEDLTDNGDTLPSGDGSTFEQVARFVVNTQQGSTSKIQRTFSIGFNRAGRLMDQLEEAGIVGPVNGSKPREVYVHSEIELQQILDQLKVQGKKYD